MIKTLSPYYVYVPLVNPNSSVVCESYTINVFIWSGNKTAVPSGPEYESTKINAAASNGTDKIDIARLVNDFIDFNITPSLITSLEDSQNQVWVKFVCYYNDEPTLPQLVFTSLAIKGYGYFPEGENPDVPTNKILLNIEEYKVNRNGLFVLPIVLEETTPPTPILEIDSITHTTGENFDLAFTTNIGYDEISYRYSITTLNDWALGGQTGLVSPFEITLPGTGITYDVQIFTYDPLTNTFVFSPTFIITTP